jgi:LacI family transcriptional regulator
MDAPKKRVTIRDIARITGFSISTVSKSFNGSYEISEKTKNKINEVAKLLGYRPNKAALTLRSGKNYVIGVVIPSLEDPFYARVFHGIQFALANTNYSVITCVTRESYEKEVKVIDKVFNQVDAFIVAAAEETLKSQNFHHLKTVQSQGKPLVLIDREIDTLKCSQVLSTNELAIKDITQKAFESKYRRIALVSCTENVNNQSKLKGFSEVNETLIHPENKKFIVKSDTENIDNDLKDFIEKNKVDCVIAMEEEASFAAIRVAKKLSKKIPLELAILGYMSEKVAKNLSTTLSTINQHRKTMGQEAMKLVLEELEKTHFKRRTIRIEPTLVERMSFRY